MAEQQELKTYNLLSLQNFDYITDKRWDDMWYIVSVLCIYCRYDCLVYMWYWLNASWQAFEPWMTWLDPQNLSSWLKCSSSSESLIVQFLSHFLQVSDQLFQVSSRQLIFVQDYANLMWWLYCRSQRNIDEILSWRNIQAWIMSGKKFNMVRLIASSKKLLTCSRLLHCQALKALVNWQFSGLHTLYGPKSGLRILHTWKSSFWSERRTLSFYRYM